MKHAIGITELKRMFAEAAKQIRQEHENLSHLDSIGVDGDHGTTILRAFEKLEQSINVDTETTLNMRLKNAGWAVLGVDGGASSALLGTFIAGMGDEDMGYECDCERLSASFSAGLRALSKQTKAQPGDKTMMDALLLAVQAFHESAEAGTGMSTAMRNAAEAARHGADSTSGMIARYGRAKFLGEKTRGFPDAGATSVALMFLGFSTALKEEEES